MSDALERETETPLAGRRLALLGKLEGTSRREARQLVRQAGGQPVEDPGEADIVVIGADEIPLGEEQTLDAALRVAVAEGRLEIISETQLWQRLGLVEADQDVRRLYTPAMLADLLGVPVATIRRWHRRGLIVPAREVRRLPYFDFQEVASARRLAQLLSNGASPAAIEKRLEELARYVPDVERPLAQLSVIVEGKRLLLRQGEGLVEPGGQLRIDFDSLEIEAGAADSGGAPPRPAVVPLLLHDSPLTPAELLELAADHEDEGELSAAAEFYRAALAAGGPRPEVVFRLAEVLYRAGDVTAARERYFAAIELDDELLEARNSLGCVLAELGQLELAAAAFEGAIRLHADYPDAHYHLAQTLDELGQAEKAAEHWRAYLALSPDDSPWADEARRRLS